MNTQRMTSVLKSLDDICHVCVFIWFCGTFDHLPEWCCCFKPSSCCRFKCVVVSRSLRLRKRTEWIKLFLWICWRKCFTLTPWDALSQATFCFINFWLTFTPTTHWTVDKRSESIKGVSKALHLGMVLQDKRKCLTPLPVAPVPSPIYHLLTMAYFFMMDPKVPKFGSSEAGMHPGQIHGRSNLHQDPSGHESTVLYSCHLLHEGLIL